MNEIGDIMKRTKRLKPYHDPWTYTGDGRWPYRIKGIDKKIMVRYRRRKEKDESLVQINIGD